MLVRIITDLYLLQDCAYLAKWENFSQSPRRPSFRVAEKIWLLLSRFPRNVPRMSNETTSKSDDLLKPSGLGVVLLALLVGITIAAYGIGSSIFPSDLFLGTLVFTVVMIGVGLIVQRTGGRDTTY